MREGCKDADVCDPHPLLAECGRWGADISSTDDSTCKSSHICCNSCRACHRFGQQSKPRFSKFLDCWWITRRRRSQAASRILKNCGAYHGQGPMACTSWKFGFCTYLSLEILDVKQVWILWRSYVLEIPSLLIRKLKPSLAQSSMQLWRVIFVEGALDL